MSGQGRGRGEAAKLPRFEEEAGSSRRPIISTGAPKTPETERSSDSPPSSEGEKPIRGRGGFRKIELRTIPSNVQQTAAKPEQTSQLVEVLSNFVKINPMSEREVHQYRIDYEPQVDSVSLRKKLFRQAFDSIFDRKCIYDGASDARSSVRIPEKKMERAIPNPLSLDEQIKLTIKHVGCINMASYEMLRLYNMHMKSFMKALGFFQLNSTGSYINAALSTPIGNDNLLMMVRGYRTAANVHDGDNILMNLESVHKIVQNENVLQYLNRSKSLPNCREIIKTQLIGKLVVTNYVKRVYKIEDVNFSLNPASTFRDHKNNKDISYSDYYQARHNATIRDMSQPLILVIPNSRRKMERDGGDDNEIYLIPELCNIAGLTDAQRSDNRLKMDLIRSSQIPPKDRVSHMNTFLTKLANNAEVQQELLLWGYKYEPQPIKIQARVLATEQIGYGNEVKNPPARWPKVDHMASFDSGLCRSTLAKNPTISRMAIFISRSDAQREKPILARLQQAFQKLSMSPGSVSTIRMAEGDSAHVYVQHLRRETVGTTVSIVILPYQNKEKYDAVKKLCSVDMGAVTQVVTSKLLMDERKANGAALKIAIQIAAKVGGEPWYVNLPLTGAMVCGYDTHHDTANRGRSFGAFVASMNNRYSRWYSKADHHDKLDELSTHLSENVVQALRKYRELNESYPGRVFIYRDGVSDGQIEHVFETELNQLRKAIKDQCSGEIRLTMIIVNKRIGARFYMKTGPSMDAIGNCSPGTIIDNTVTRKERYDFYLVSQSTRHGTVSPTYYNIIHDESGMTPNHHQSMAYKFCFLYYNWTGSVRVPAPCQYAHKLAMLCGEHLHSVPNATLDDKLHFL